MVLGRAESGKVILGKFDDHGLKVPPLDLWPERPEPAVDILDRRPGRAAFDHHAPGQGRAVLAHKICQIAAEPL